MRNKKIFLFIFLSIILIFIVLINEKIKYKNFSSSFNCEPDIICIGEKVADQFSIGMTKNDTYNKILIIDSSLEDEIEKNYFCNVDLDYCYELLDFFANEIQPTLRIMFIFSKEEILQEVRMVPS